jgi:hypothetical protein
MADNEEHELGYFDLNSKIRLIISTVEWRSNQYIDIREHYIEDDRWRPRKKGVRFNSKILPELIKLLKKECK